MAGALTGETGEAFFRALAAHLSGALDAGLVDELRLLVHPVAARHGRRLFDEGDAPYHLTLTSAEVFPTGVIRVIYSPTQSSPGQVGYDEVKEHLDGA